MPANALRNRGLTIGQIASRTGLAPSAIRYYEDERLVTPDRNESGHRRYARSDIRRLSFVMISQGLGFTISEIREALTDLPENRTPNKGDWARISRRFGKVLDDRIEQMQALRARLDGCIGCGCLSLETCKLYNPDDKARQTGTGPRLVVQKSTDEASG